MTKAAQILEKIALTGLGTKNISPIAQKIKAITNPTIKGRLSKRLSAVIDYSRDQGQDAWWSVYPDAKTYLNNRLAEPGLTAQQKINITNNIKHVDTIAKQRRGINNVKRVIK